MFLLEHQQQPSLQIDRSLNLTRLKTFVHEEDHEHLSHAIQGEERGDEIKGLCLHCCMRNCGKPQHFCREISS